MDFKSQSIWTYMTDLLARDTLYRELQRRILDHEFQPGEVLPIRRLARELGVSTTPVREALLRLEGEFLVDRAPNNSARVAEITYKDIRDIVEVRVSLGRQCGMLAALRITEAEKTACREFLSDLMNASDFKQVTQADIRLTEALYVATQNALLQRFYLLVRYQASHLYDLIENKDAWTRRIREEWSAIVDAVCSGDGALSASLLQDHVRGFVGEMGQTLQRPPY